MSAQINQILISQAIIFLFQHAAILLIAITQIFKKTLKCATKQVIIIFITYRQVNFNDLRSLINSINDTL